MMHFASAGPVVPAVLTQVATSRLEGIIEGSIRRRGSQVRRSQWKTRRMGGVGLGNSQGFYVFPSLTAGECRVTVEAQGFRQAVLKGVMLSVATTTTAPFRLGSAAEALRLLPDPNDFDIGDQLNSGGFRFNTPSDGREDGFTVRADQNLGNAVRLFFRL
jgi:hypothetical protein